MFERNPVDNSSVMTVAVEIAMTDGEVVTGRAALPPSRQVHRLLEGNDPFLYLEQFDGEGRFIPRAGITSLKVVATVRSQALRLPAVDANSFDPWRVLGVEKGSPWDDVRAAYHRMAKTYHPDRFAGMDVAPEIAAYLEAKTKQINAAFRVLKSPNRHAAA